MKTPFSDYVDYTTRRRQGPVINPNLETTANSISSARERRAKYFHQLAQSPVRLSYDDESYMDSPFVRRHVGIDAQVADIRFDDSDVDETLLKSEWKIDDFKVGRHLGTGKFGTVYLAQEKRSKMAVALKILRKEELEEANVIQFIKREIEIQAHLNHPHIIRLFGYFHDDTNVYAVLEYAEHGDLFKQLNLEKSFDETKTVNYVVQLSSALEYMHSLGVIHRDLKLENILLGENNQVKIGDFGWAVHDPRPRRKTFCGTLDYLPPEMIANEPHSQKADVWALGVICYELMMGRPPFEELSENETVSVEKTYDRIKKVDVKFPVNISKEAQSFILRVTAAEEPFKKIEGIRY
ncbi:kinase-like domain-containing protein [Sporodiniella umbellata]|nr:kinase-like domain-containing protein [Sporodiniella umbellata]